MRQYRYTATIFENWEREFARKLIRPFGSVTKEDIENEVKAITDICASGGHRHVIQFRGHGPLRGSDYYYIDMELCDFNLDKYIHSPNRSLLFPGLKREAKERLKPAFYEEWSSIQE